MQSLVDRKVAVTLSLFQEKLDNIRGAVTMGMFTVYTILTSV